MGALPPNLAFNRTPAYAFLSFDRLWPGAPLGRMKSDRHDAFVLMVAVAAAWLATPWARAGWSIVAMPRSFTTSLVWLDYAYMSLWAFETLWAGLFGLLLTRLLRSSPAILWALLFGVGLGLWHFVNSSNRIGADAPSSMYVWAYGQYLVPIVGALIGYWLANRLPPKYLEDARDAA